MDGEAQSFDTEAARYDAWFDSPHGRVLFANEVAALRTLWPGPPRPALEIGVGTGRFAQALGVEHGADPAAGAIALAAARGIDATRARGEALPFADASFAGVLLVTTLGFTSDPAAVVREAARVLRPAGRLLIGEIPRESAWGRSCAAKQRAGDPFFRGLRQFSVEEIAALLAQAGLESAGFASTLIRSAPGAPCVEPPQPGRSDAAGFVAMLAVKRARGATAPGR